MNPELNDDEPVFANIQPSPLLTVEENVLLDVLAMAWNMFIKLPELHGADRNEFSLAVHALQNIVMSRAVMREAKAKG
jgi:hypothetical protein